MAELPDEMIYRIRHSGYVHGVEDLREEIMRKSTKASNNLILDIRKLTEIVERLETGDNK